MLTSARNLNCKKLSRHQDEKSVVLRVFIIKELFQTIICYLFLPAKLKQYDYSISNWMYLHTLQLVCSTWKQYMCEMKAFLSDVMVFNNASLASSTLVCVKNLFISDSNFDSVFQFASTLKRCHFNRKRLPGDLFLYFNSDVLEEIEGVFVYCQDMIDVLKISLPNLKRGTFHLSEELNKCAFINFTQLEEITISGAFGISKVFLAENAKLKKVGLWAIKKLTLQNIAKLETLHCWSDCMVSFDIGSVQNLKNLHVCCFPCLTQILPFCNTLSHLRINFGLIDQWITQLTTLESLTIYDIRNQYLKKNGKSSSFAMFPAVKKLRLESFEFEFFDEFLTSFDGHNLQTLELDCEHNYYNLLYSNQNVQKAVCAKFPNLKSIVFHNLTVIIRKRMVFQNANIDVYMRFET